MSNKDITTFQGSINFGENESTQEKVSEQSDNDSREKFEEDSSPQRIATELQNSVDSIILNCPDVDWNEDYISYQIVTEIRNVLSRYKIPNIKNIGNYSSNKEKFDIEAYKLTGKAEQTHGDIAIVITKTSSKGRPMTGVGFYEAKASCIDSVKYPSFSIQQLRRLVTKTPKLSYLLYSKEALPSDTQEWSICNDSQNYSNFLRYSHDNRSSHYANTVDANFLKQCRNLHEATERVGLSFGYHFVYKLLSGRELDYSRRPETTIKNWLKTTRRAKALVISIAVQEEGAETVSAQLQLTGFKKINLSRLGSNSLLSYERRFLESDE